MVLLFWFSHCYGPWCFSLSRPGPSLPPQLFFLSTPGLNLRDNSWFELEGRFLMAEFSRRDSVFRIASVYAPNRNPERDEFFYLMSGLC